MFHHSEDTLASQEIERMFANAVWPIHAKDEVVIDAAFALFGHDHHFGCSLVMVGICPSKRQSMNLVRLPCCSLDIPFGTNLARCPLRGNDALTEEGRSGRSDIALASNERNDRIVAVEQHW